MVVCLWRVSVLSSKWAHHATTYQLVYKTHRKWKVSQRGLAWDKKDKKLSRLSLSQCSDWLTSRQELNEKNSQLFLLAPLSHHKFGMHCQDCQQKYRGFKENPAWCRGWMSSPSKTRKGLIESWQPYEGGRKTHSKQRRPSGACDTWGKSVSCNTPQPLSSLSLAHTFFTR